MTVRRPAAIIVTLIALAAASLAGSDLLDHHRSWADARQAGANILWIIFLLAVLALAVTGVGILQARHRTHGHSTHHPDGGRTA